MSMEKNNIKMSPVLFNEDGHTYTLEGHTLQGVTPIIAWLFPDTYSGIPKSVLDAAAEYGSLIHKKCELADSLGVVDDESVRSYVELKEQHGLKTLYNEYLVSDERNIASSIDVLCEGYDIIDIKTTSKVHIPNVTLQTSIYAWLFELQNEGKSAGRLFCMWLPKPQYGKADLIELQRVPANICAQVVDLYLQGANPIQARALLTACGFGFDDKRSYCDVPQGVQEMMEELQMVKENLDALKKREDELKAAIFEVMKAEKRTKWGTDLIEFTVKKAYVTTSVDSAKLKTDYPDVFEACKKERNVSESITYKLL